MSPLVVTAQPREAPPADLTLNLEADDESTDPQRVSIWTEKAWQTGGKAKVVLSCFVDAHGIAEHCHVAWESPQGQGFGASAMALQPTLRLTPKTGADGKPMAATMNVAVQFKKPEFENNLQDFERSLGLAQGEMCLSNCSIGQDLQLNHNPLEMHRVTMMSHPVWSAAPSFDDLAAAYPRRGDGKEGFAVVHCEVLGSGALTRCFAAKEDPVRHGFADAAVQLASKFTVSAQVMKYAPHGDPIAVDIPIRFVPPNQLAERDVAAPVWLAGVDPEYAPKVFPPEAASKGLATGHGVARCTVASDGSLRGCQAESGDPDGLGFGEAAAKLASTMRMNLWGSDAQPVEGGTVRVAIHLNLAGETLAQ